MFLPTKNLKKCLFLDIETVSAEKTYDLLPENLKALWDLKCKSINRDFRLGEAPSSLELYGQKAGIYAEFAKVVCISVGYLIFENEVPVSAKLKSFYGDDEAEILRNFTSLLETHYNNPERDSLCGHNIKEFDVPFLCRRMIINRIPFPAMLDLSGKKPWQTTYLLDTMDMWRFGDFKNYTSLNLLAGILGIPSPKDDIDGSMVGKTYWEDENLSAIVKYCEKDVATVIQIMLRYAGCEFLPESVITGSSI